MVKLKEVASIGVTVSPGFACGGKDGGFRMLQMPEYPPHPEGEMLRDLRVSFQIGLREAADAMGVSATDLSALERGSKAAEDTAGWKWLMQCLVELKEKKSAP